MNIEPHLNASSEPLSPALEPEIAEWVPTIEADLPLVALDGEIDPESIVEEAEQLLREGAPHDFDVLVIGGGPAGTAAALQAARGGLHVAIVEARALGGVYLHHGCLSSKMLLSAVETVHPSGFPGAIAEASRLDFVDLQSRVAQLTEQKRVQIEAELEAAGIEIVPGSARFVEEHTLQIEHEGQTRRVTAVHVVIAAGGAAQRLSIEGAQLAGVVVPDQILAQSHIPPRLVVIGAGFIGIELAFLFAALGAQVTLLEASEAILPGEDEEIQAALQLSLQNDGIRVETDLAVTRIEAHGGVLRVVFDQDEGIKTVDAEQVLLTTARVANLENLGLAEAGIAISSGKIEVDDDLQTTTSGVYAIGDCVRRDGWVNQAVRDGREVANAILGTVTAAPSHFVPRCCFSSPSTASVGLMQREALELGIEALSSRADFSSNALEALFTHRDRNDNPSTSWTKLVFEKDTTRLLGCHIIGPGAPEIIGEAALAIHSGLTLHDLATTVQAHPSVAEILTEAARSALRSAHGTP